MARLPGRSLLTKAGGLRNKSGVTGWGQGVPQPECGMRYYLTIIDRKLGVKNKIQLAAILCEGVQGGGPWPASAKLSYSAARLTLPTTGRRLPLAGSGREPGLTSSGLVRPSSLAYLRISGSTCVPSSRRLVMASS